MFIGINTAYALKKLLKSRVYNISYLNMGKNMLGDIGLKVIAKAVGNSKTLVHLDLCSNEIKKEGADKFFNELQQNHSLTCLYIGNAKGLHRNFLGGSALVGLGTLLEIHQQLTILDLQNAGIGDEGVAAITNGILKSKALIILNISSNAITNNSNKHLIAIMNMSGIKRFNVSKNILTDEFKLEASRLIKGQIGRASCRERVYVLVEI